MGFQLTGSGSRTVGLGLLVIRIGIGLSMFFLHGYGKLLGGRERWAGLGSGMESFGITFAPEFWGFMATMAEGICSLLIIIGFPFRPAVAALAFTMLVAAVRHLTLPEDNPRSGFSGAEPAIKYFVVFLGLLITGPGRYGLRWVRRRGRE